MESRMIAFDFIGTVTVASGIYLGEGSSVSGFLSYGDGLIDN